MADASSISTGGVNGEVETVTRATPNALTSPPPTSGPDGSTVLNDEVAFSELVGPVVSGTGAGTMTAKLFSPSSSTCRGPAAFAEVIVASNGSGPYNTTGGPTADPAGTWHWSAVYSGDADNNGVATGCSVEQVTTATATAPPGSASSLPFTGAPFMKEVEGGLLLVHLEAGLVLVDIRRRGRARCPSHPRQHPWIPHGHLARGAPMPAGQNSGGCGQSGPGSSNSDSAREALIATSWSQKFPFSISR